MTKYVTKDQKMIDTNKIGVYPQISVMMFWAMQIANSNINMQNK